MLDMKRLLGVVAILKGTKALAGECLSTTIKLKATTRDTDQLLILLFLRVLQREKSSNNDNDDFVRSFGMVRLF
jgi:hypothetical protein